MSEIANKPTWTRPPALRPASAVGWVNVGQGERIVSALAGGMLVAWGARHGRLLGALSALGGAGLIARGATGHCPAVAALSTAGEAAYVSRATISITRPREAVYRFWREEANVPLFMQGVESIQQLPQRLTAWTVRGPLGRRLKWVSRIVEDKPPGFVAWESIEGADVPNSGWVEFHDAGGGLETVVTVFIAYEPPGGAMGHLLASLLGHAPAQTMRNDLRRLKRLLEAQVT